MRRDVNSLPALGALQRRAERWKPVYPEDIEGQYHETGHLIFDPAIPEATINAAAREMLESETTKGKDWHHGARLMDGWRDGGGPRHRHVRRRGGAR